MNDEAAQAGLETGLQAWIAGDLDTLQTLLAPNATLRGPEPGPHVRHIFTKLSIPEAASETGGFLPCCVGSTTGNPARSPGDTVSRRSGTP
jgi:hypothetical protein